MKFWKSIVIIAVGLLVSVSVGTKTFAQGEQTEQKAQTEQVAQPAAQTFCQDLSQACSGAGGTPLVCFQETAVCSGADPAMYETACISHPGCIAAQIESVINTCICA
jgi:hypothetical protein